MIDRSPLRVALRSPQVDKKHHFRRDEIGMHSEKALQLGEKVFTSGGMKKS